MASSCVFVLTTRPAVRGGWVGGGLFLQCCHSSLEICFAYLRLWAEVAREIRGLFGLAVKSPLAECHLRCHFLFEEDEGIL